MRGEGGFFFGEELGWEWKAFKGFGFLVVRYQIPDVHNEMVTEGLSPMLQKQGNEKVKDRRSSSPGM